MVKHKACATTIVTPKLEGSMTTKGQMKPTCRMSLTESHARENSQSNVPKHTILSNVLTDLIFRRILKRAALSGPTIESVKQLKFMDQTASNSKFETEAL